MRRVKTCKGILIAMLAFAMMISGISVYAASSDDTFSVTLKNYTAPKALKTGQGFTIKGGVHSTATMKRIEAGVVNSSGKWTAQKYDNKSVNAKYFKLSTADSSLKFGKLSAGTYYYRIYVHPKNGKVKTVLNQKFTVSKPVPTITNHTYPVKLKKGKSFSLKGRVNSEKKITKITVGVVDKFTGEWTAEKYTGKPNAKVFKISKADSSIHFGKLEGGDYYYRVVVTNADGTFTVLDREFEVEDPDGGTEGGSLGGGSSGITLSGCNTPIQYNVGKKFTVKGTINSEEVIREIEIGIVMEATNKWTDYKYEGIVGDYKFNIGKVASKLKFDQLAGGTYYYRIYAHTDSGVKIVANKKFKVIPSNKPQAAVNWAINIANDDSFSYGKKPETSRVGCYFCGTNQRNKPEGYEKTYVCMTFVHAAFAHGAGDPELLAECRKGKHCLELTETNLTRYSCWMKVGMAKDLTVSDLMVGDVIVWYSADNTHGHLSIYAGNGAIVDCTSATGDVWGPSSIAYRAKAANSYLKQAATRSTKSYVMRYRK